MSNNKLPAAVASLVAVAALANAAFAQGTPGDKARTAWDRKMQAQAQANIIADFLWTKQPWVNQDQPYKKISDAIEQAVKHGADPEELRERYALLAKRSPNDPKALFRWACAAYQTGTSQQCNYLDGEKILDDVSIAFSKPVMPMTYHTARLRFLREAHSMAFPQLKAIGQRLFLLNPQDKAVEFYLAAILRDSPLSQERQQALADAKDLIRRDPKFSGCYSLLGSIYYASWSASKSRVDADNAIAAYQQALRLAPAQYGFRQKAEMLISLMQKG